jgi:hypothetical protein
MKPLFKNSEFAFSSHRVTRYQVKARGLRRAGPSTPKPDYAAIDDHPLSKVVYSLFRAKMVLALDGQDSSMEGYDAIIDLTRRLNSLGPPRVTQDKTRKILQSLFPSWLPPAFKVGNIGFPVCFVFIQTRIPVNAGSDKQ